MGLPEFDPVRLTIEGEDGLQGTQAGEELLDADTAGLWMAGASHEQQQHSSTSMYTARPSAGAEEQGNVGGPTVNEVLRCAL